MTNTTNTTMKREILFTPAYDKRDTDPAKNYGIHGLHITFNLINNYNEGITFSISTNWHLPHVQEEIDNRLPYPGFPYLSHKPQPFGLDGHWKTPRYEGQEAIKNCKITKGDCYCYGTSLTEDLFNLLVSEGEEAMWQLMEDRFNYWSKKEIK